MSGPGGRSGKLSAVGSVAEVRAAVGKARTAALNAPRPVRIAVGAALLAVAIVVPLGLEPYWQGVLFFPVGRLHPAGAGTEHRRGPGRAARPRVRGVLRRGRVHDGQADHGSGVVGVDLAAGGHRPGLRGRGAARGADPAPTGRLPGHRHPRVRRDRPHRGPELGVAGRGAGYHRHPPPRGRVRPRRPAVLLPHPGGHRPGHRHDRPPQFVAGGAGVGRHPGGRGRGRGHGRPHVQDEAVGLRHGRVHRRAGWVALRQQGELRQPRQLPVLLLRPDPLRRGPGRHGLDPRRDRWAPS